MSYDVISVPNFKKEIKFPSLKSGYSGLIESLEPKPQQGVALDKNCYKIRLAIKSKRKAKVVGQELS